MLVAEFHGAKFMTDMAALVPADARSENIAKKALRAVASAMGFDDHDDNDHEYTTELARVGREIFDREAWKAAS